MCVIIGVQILPFSHHIFLRQTPYDQIKASGLLTWGPIFKTSLKKLRKIVRSFENQAPDAFKTQCRLVHTRCAFLRSAGVLARRFSSFFERSAAARSICANERRALQGCSPKKK